MSSPLSDQPAREAIGTALEATLFVEASAGSGKTTQLVARLVNLLVSGRARVDQVAAITFTEAAAGELRDRLAGELEVVASGRAAPASVAAGAAAVAAAEALEGLDGAAITTLHGFARRLLTEHPFAAGLPLAFEVLDEVRAAVDFADRWVGMVDRLLDDADDARALQWGMACGVTLDALRSIARDLDASWDRVPEEDAPRSSPPAIARDDVLVPLRAALDMVGACTDPDDLLLARLGQLEPWADQLAGCDDEVELLGVLQGLRGRVGTTRGRAASWDGRKPEVVALLGRAQAARERTVSGAADFALRRLGTAIGAMVREAAAGRRREGRLHFHDLLVLARDLVRFDREAQAAIHDQYRFVLVDEFQDTDPLQADLAMRIASPPTDTAERRWQELEAGSGRLFFVGDPKQAIYRFRGADDRLFHEVKSLLADEPLALTANFRSTPGIVAWVDAVFPLLVPADGPAHVESSAARQAHPGGRPPVVVLGADHASPSTADQSRAAEAMDVAAVVLAARDDGWPVGDGSRSAGLADIAVLVRTRAVVPALEEAFGHAGIPYRLESSSLVYQSTEVHDLLSILHAVDDPTDQASVVAALRSPAFACGDDDLLRHRQAGGRWDYRTDRSTEGPVADAFAALRALHDDRWWLEVSELVARVVEQRRLLPLCLDGPRWREAWRRLRWVVDQARQFTESSAGDLREYLKWVDVQRDESARVTEVVLPEGDVDAVRVMTVHAAKGLEFPVVVVAGFGTGSRHSGAGVLFGPDGPELAARQGLATPGYAALAGAEEALDDAERVRLLYVATTRARDHLVVSVHRPAQAGTTLAARVAEACDGCSGLWRRHTAVLPLAGSRQVTTAAEATAADDERDRAEWAAERDRRMGPGAIPKTVAATAVARLVGGDATAAETGDTGRPAWRRGRAGTAVGRAVHAVLQTVDLAAGEGVEALAAAHALAEGVPSRAGDVEALARSALDSAVVRSAVAAGRYWRELYVGTPVGSRVLEGIVDLLFDGPAGLEVVDYKTDQAEDLDWAVARYRPQGAAYALAVEQVLGRPVGRCTFLFLRPDGAVAREVIDLGSAKSEVAATLATG